MMRYFSLQLLALVGLAAAIRLPTPVVKAGNNAIWLAHCLQLRSAGCRLGTDVEVRPSGKKGNGLFAMRSIEEGSVIGRYNGELLTDEQYEVRLQESDDGEGMYVMGLGNGYVIDGEDPSKSTFVRYMNHSRRRANCRAEEVVDTDVSGPFAAVAVMAERDIAAGEELLFDCEHATISNSSEARPPPSMRSDLMPCRRCRRRGVLGRVGAPEVLTEEAANRLCVATARTWPCYLCSVNSFASSEHVVQSTTAVLVIPHLVCILQTLSGHNSQARGRDTRVRVCLHR